jgi:cell wall-associated NlpC family hydrolase
MKYNHLLGQPFRYGKTDCYGLVRAFYRDNFNIDLPNYARVEDWWDHGFNFFMDFFHENNFRSVEDHPADWKPGDLILMAIRSKVANHSAVLLEGGKIIHHLYGQLSRIDDYRGLYRNTTVAVLRHKDVKITNEQHTLDLMELLPDGLRRKLSAPLQQR